MGTTGEIDMVRQRQERRAEWAEIAAGYAAHADALDTHWGAAGQLLVQMLGLAPGMHVLDLACGIGEPALTIADIVAPDGRVIATDLVPEMLAAAARRAEERGVRNIWFEQADAERLPFPDASFDRVSCRFGAMYFPDLSRALGEMRRVLKPGGRVALAVWGPAGGNTLMRALAPLGKYAAAPDPDAPDMFRFAAAGALAGELRAAGFASVEETVQTLEKPWPGGPEDGWEAVMATSPSMRRTVEGLAPEERDAVRRGVLAGLAGLYDGRQLNFTAPVIVAAGAR